ncbi:MAG TPA: ABC transporter permease [Chloroflexota bacterium]|nr:ABC transporter permease [Chloroflexota bacterium]
MSTTATALAPESIPDAPAAFRAIRSRGMWDRLRPALLSPPIMASLIFLAGITLVAIVVPLLPVPDPDAQSVLFRLKGPSGVHWLGTDRLGRDVMSRVLWGSRVSLVVGFSVVAISGTAGTLLGLVSGYYDNWLSQLIMRVVDMVLAFPPLILALVVVTVMGDSLQNVVWAISITAIPRFTRLARSSILAIREREYVAAARSIGARTASIMFKQVLLNAIDPLIVVSTLAVPGAILTEALLSFLGHGVVPPTPTWGNMINDGRLVLQGGPWLTIFPGIAIVLTVMAFNLIGDAVRDALDPSVSD